LAVIEVAVAAEIVALVAPIQRVFRFGVGLKPVPVSDMFVPGTALAGEKVFNAG